MYCTIELIITLRFRARRNLKDYPSHCVPETWCKEAAHGTTPSHKRAPEHNVMDIKISSSLNLRVMVSSMVIEEPKLCPSINTDTKGSTRKHLKRDHIIFFSRVNGIYVWFSL